MHISIPADQIWNRTSCDDIQAARSLAKRKNRKVRTGTRKGDQWLPNFAKSERAQHNWPAKNNNAFLNLIGNRVKQNF